MQRSWCPGGPDVGLSWVDDISGLIGLVRLTGWWVQPGKRVSYSRALMLPHCQENCPLGLNHSPGGLTDDHENDPWPRCAGAGALAESSPVPAP
jgi:hypothetical protein